MNVIAFIIFLIPQTRKRLTTLNLGCIFVIIGVWIEKGPGFVIPGFVPDPLGEIHEYLPNLLELMVSFGIWALGLLVFTLLMKVAIPIETGKFSQSQNEFRQEEIKASSIPLKNSVSRGCLRTAQEHPIYIKILQK